MSMFSERNSLWSLSFVSWNRLLQMTTGPSAVVPQVEGTRMIKYVVVEEGGLGMNNSS